VADKKPTYEQLKHALEQAPPIRQIPDRIYERYYREVVLKALDGTLVVKR
jgi:hypothetical protein